jgi:hypothetical protein
MSLDVYLITKEPNKKVDTGVFIREDSNTRELTIDEVRERYPNATVGEQEYVTDEVYSRNITHNLGEMADKAGIYYACWRPEEKGWKLAKDITPALERGLKDLKKRPEYYKKFNSENGWGLYEHFVPFVEEYLEACKEYPDAEIGVSR